MLLVNANVLTMDPFRPRAEWVVTRGGTIESVGPEKEFGPSAATGHERVDCGGRTILPGFIDAHCHLRAYAESLVTLDLGPDGGIRSIPDIQAAVRNRARIASPGAWIRGGGYDEFRLAEKRHPTRRDLDEAAPDLPVKLTHRSGHAHVLNSAALRLAGISVETPDPAGGLIDRDIPSGEPTGVLFEMGGFLSERIPAPDSRSLLSGVKLVDERLLRSGITSVHDVSRSNGMDRWNEFRSWKENGLFRPSVRMTVGPKHLPDLERKACGSGAGGNVPRITGVKIFLDETSGDLRPPQAELDDIVLRAHRSGYQVAVHAVEMPAIASACSAIRFASESFPGVAHRHRVEHCSVCDPALARRLASLGVTVVTQPAFLYYHGDRYLGTVPRQQRDSLYPLRTLLENGVRVAAGSDFPMVPPDPLVGLYAAVTRRSRTGEAVSEEQAIPPGPALRMFTLDAARATFDEGVRGAVAPGMAADLVLLSDDPTRVAPEEIRNIRVEMTILGGEVVWDATR
jgi:predicted amidohydrolase YtcJ